MTGAPPSSLVKAYLSISSPVSPAPPPGGTGSNAAVRSSGLGTLTFKFNPKDYSIDKKANWHADPKASPKKKAPEPQYLGPDPRSLKLEIFFDESDSADGDVSKDVDVLMSCCNVVRNVKPPRPPTVVFGWGTHVSFKAYLESVSAKFTMFRPDGTPYRATCSVTLKELPEDLPATNPTSGTPVVDRVRTVTAGDSLASLAYREYQDPGLWRAIAEANGIDDPMRLTIGTTLLLPSPEEAKAYA